MSFGNLFQSKNQKEKYAQDMFLKSWKELNECQRQQVIEAIHTIEKVKKEYPNLARLVKEYHKKDIHGDLCDLMRSYLDKFGNNMELLDKFSLDLYLKPFNEICGREKILILKSIEPFIKTIEEKHIYTEEELLKGKKCQDLHTIMACRCGIDVNDLPSMTKRTDSQKCMIEDIVNQLKEFGTEEVIKHYQNMIALEKPYYYWEDLEIITSPVKGSTKIPIKTRMMLNVIANNNYKKVKSNMYKDEVEKRTSNNLSSMKSIDINDLPTLADDPEVKQFCNMKLDNTGLEKWENKWKPELINPVLRDLYINYWQAEPSTCIDYNFMCKAFNDQIKSANKLGKNVIIQWAKCDDSSSIDHFKFRLAILGQILDSKKDWKRKLELRCENVDSILNLDEQTIIELLYWYTCKRNTIKGEASDTLIENKDVYSKVAKEIYNKPYNEVKKDNDNVNHPSHYLQNGRKFEPISVINDWKLSYNVGNCLKYLSRAGAKDDIKQDMNKAVFYLLYECKMLGLTKEQILKTVESVFEKR